MSDSHHDLADPDGTETYTSPHPGKDSLKGSLFINADTLPGYSVTPFDTSSLAATRTNALRSPSPSTESWVSPLKSCFDAMVLEPVREYTDFFEPMEVVDDDDDDGEVDDSIVAETDIDNKGMPPSRVVFWSGKEGSKAIGVCPSLLLPTPRLDFRDTVYMGNIAWADKSRGILKLSAVQPLSNIARFPIVCRPSGFGKTSFSTMLQSFHSIRDERPAPARRVFNQMSLDFVFEQEVELRNYHFQDHLVLSFNLANLNIASPERFKEAVLNRIHSVLSGFIFWYGYLLDKDRSKRTNPAIFDPAGRFNLFATLLKWLTGCTIPVFLIIDNYDSAQRASNGDGEITDILHYHLIKPLYHICHQFIIRRGIILGQATPTELRRHCGRDIWTVGYDCSRDYRLQTTFGLTRSEIRDICVTFGVPGVEKEIFASLTGHFFSDHFRESVYCAKDVLDFLRRQPSLVNRTYIDCHAAFEGQP